MSAMLKLSRTPLIKPGKRVFYRSFQVQRLFKPDLRWPDWEVVVGIELHTQIKSRHKLFSNAQTPSPASPPNTHVSAYDASFPGTLPRINPKCVELAVRTAVALNSQIQARSVFDRKHYYYPDLPSGYQITQHYSPLALGGFVKLQKTDVTVRIKQIQIEQDTAKTSLDSRQCVSRIDLNRAGSPLMEIVSEPDIRSPEEAGEYVKTLQAVLRSIGASDGNMEQGSLRCDVNVSVNKPDLPLGTRCEIKNLNSIKSVRIAITAEVYRQIALLSSGLAVDQETRGFDEHSSQTFKLRSKEDSPDYRYMPDPNLPPLLLSPEYISHVRVAMPPLPEAIRNSLSSKGLSDRDIDVLMSIDAGAQVPFDGEERTCGAMAYFYKVAEGRNPKVVVNWMTHELLGQLSASGQTFADNPISAEQMGELVDMVHSGTITGTSGKLLLRHLIKTRSKDSARKLAEEYLSLTFSSPHQMSLVSLRSLCEEAILAFPEEADKVRRSSGDAPVIHRLVGAVMKRSKGKADAKAAKEMLLSIILRHPSD